MVGKKKREDFAVSFLSGGIELPKEEKPVLVLPVIGLGGSSLHPQVRFFFFRLELWQKRGNCEDIGFDFKEILDSNGAFCFFKVTSFFARFVKPTVSVHWKIPRKY